MMQLLMPNQVTPYWDEIRAGLVNTLPPGPPDREQRLLAKILQGLVQVWLSYRREGSKPVVDAVVITAVVEDIIHDTRNLWLYALWTIDETRASTWREGIRALKKYAKGRQCSRIIAYSNNEEVLGMAEALGANMDFTFITWDV